MTNTQAVETNQEYRNIPLAILVESPTNPRKRFDEGTLADLAAQHQDAGSLGTLAGAYARSQQVRRGHRHRRGPG